MTRTYYGQPVLKPPAWTWEVPWYLFTGGLAGGSSTIAAVARARGDAALADRAGRVALWAAAVSPMLLVKDLGRPARFLNMLRVFKPTSAMSMGSWLLTVYGAAATTAGGLGQLGRLPRIQRAAEAGAGLLGPLMATYTGALVADSAIPVWHEARRELPFAFAGSALATSGAAVLVGGADPAARRVLLAGAGLELAGAEVMQRRLGEVGEVYEEGSAGRLAKAAKGLTTAGAALCAVAPRLGRRGALASRLGAGLVLAGGASLRWAVYRAGGASATRTPLPPTPRRAGTSPESPPR